MIIAKITSLGGTGLKNFQSHTQRFYLLGQEAGALDLSSIKSVRKKKGIKKNPKTKTQKHNLLKTASLPRFWEGGELLCKEETGIDGGRWNVLFFLDL